MRRGVSIVHIGVAARQGAPSTEKAADFITVPLWSNTASLKNLPYPHSGMASWFIT